MSALAKNFRTLCLSGECAGRVALDQISRVEDELGVSLPPEYKSFLEEFGAMVAPGIEIYGVFQNTSDDAPMWQSVVEVTKSLRVWQQVGAEREGYLPISDDGMGTYFFLDTTSGRNAQIFAIGPGVNIKVADNFVEFVVRFAEGSLEY